MIALASASILVNRAGTPCKTGYKYGAPLHLDKLTDEVCDVDSSCNSMNIEIVVPNDILVTTSNEKRKNQSYRNY